MLPGASGALIAGRWHKRAVLAGLMVLAACGSSVGPPQTVSARQLVCINPYPPGCGAPITVEDDITIDILPIGVIYHPPGAASDVGQTLTQSQRFATITTVTRTRTEGHPTMFAAPESLQFFKGTEAGEEEEWATQTSNGTWRIRVTSQSWASGGPVPTFPGDGDRILFYVRARFHVVFQVGVFSDGAEHYYDPALIEMTPIDGPWTTVAVTAAQLRSGDLPSSVPLDDDTVEDLLALDPFTRVGHERAGKRSLGHLGLAIVDSGTPSDPNLSSRRFTQVSEIPDVWWPCGSSTKASQSLELGDFESTTVTRSRSSTTDVTGIGKTTFTFEYSVNRMTESSSTTEAVARFGGGTDCSAEAPMYETETWYDTMSGTLAFPTSQHEPGNVESLAADASGMPLSYQAVIIRDAEGRRVRTFTREDGTFRLRLEPGRYTAIIDGERGAKLEHPFDVPSSAGLTRLDPLRFGGPPEPRGAGRPLPLVDEPAPTPTSTPAPDPDVRGPRQATATPTPDPPERRPVLPTATSTSTLRNPPGR